MAEWVNVSDTELLAALGPAQHKMNAAHRETLELVAKIARRRCGTGAGYRSEVELLHLTQHITMTAARARLSAAAEVLPGRSLTGDVLEPAMPATAVAVAEDAVSAEHVAAIRSVLDSLPAEQADERDGLESDLAGWARQFDPWVLRQLGKAAMSRIDPDGPKPRSTDPAGTRLSIVADGDGFSLAGWLDTEAHATLFSALSPICGPEVAEDGTRDPRSRAERYGAALVDLSRRMLDLGTLPGEMRQKPHLVVTVPLDVLETGTGTALLDFANGTLPGMIAAEDARRLACDAHRSHLRLNGKSLPLDAGRTSYVIPRHIRRALHQRDHGCAFPACSIPPQWTDGHHVTHWADGGVTAMHNLVLLCSQHHLMIHTSEWSVEIADGWPVFHPPPWQNAGPRMNPLHRPDRIPGG